MAAASTISGVYLWPPLTDDRPVYHDVLDYTFASAAAENDVQPTISDNPVSIMDRYAYLRSTRAQSEYTSSIKEPYDLSSEGMLSAYDM